MRRLAPRPRRTSGFTLLEVAVTAAILAIAALTLTAAIASNQKLNALARERSLATNAIQAYVEYMRQKYPVHGSADMTGLLEDPLTPADFLPGGSRYVGLGTNQIEVSAVRDARGLVLKLTDETGGHWGPCAGTASWRWTTPNMTATGSIDTTVATVPTIAEKESLGLVNANTGAIGKDLDGNGTTDNTPATAGYTYVDPTKQLFVPCEITLSWLSGSSGSNTAGDAQAARQRITIYAAFGPQH